jgi:hypothetical protein
MSLLLGMILRFCSALLIKYLRVKIKNLYKNFQYIQKLSKLKKKVLKFERNLKISKNMIFRKSRKRKIRKFKICQLRQKLLQIGSQTQSTRLKIFICIQRILHTYVQRSSQTPKTPEGERLKKC